MSLVIVGSYHQSFVGSYFLILIKLENKLAPPFRVGTKKKEGQGIKTKNLTLIAPCDPHMFRFMVTFASCSIV